MIRCSNIRSSSIRYRWLAVMMSVVLGTSVVAVSGVRQQGTELDDKEPDQPVTEATPAGVGVDEFSRIGEEMTGNLCIDCHGWDEIFMVRRTAREWEIVVRDMAGRGVVGTSDQLALVRRYLTWSFGLVAVNTATAEELSVVLGLPMPQAEAIVAYRQAHGKFPDLPALSKVPGVDKTILAAQIDAMRFE